MDQKSPKDMTFLVVDDMDTMRRSVRAMLKLINYGKKVYEAPHGQEAWDMLASGALNIDFIICDYAMPYLTGTELLNKMRSSRKLRDIPFLMITADANKEIVAEAAENDVDAYLAKPFVTASLEAKIDELISRMYNPDKTSSLLRACREKDESGDLAGAIELALAACKSSPRLSRPFRELGVLFVKKRATKKAITAFNRAIDLNRLDVTSYHYLGQLYYHTGEINKAITAYTKAMDISPRQSERAFNFVKLLLKKQKKDEAEKILKMILKYHHANLDVLEKIAVIASRAGFYPLAIKCYKKILKFVPDKMAIRKRLGIALHEQGKYNEAANQLEKAAQKFSQDVSLLLVLAQTYLDMGMPIRADKWAAAVLRIEPENREAHKILVQCA